MNTVLSGIISDKHRSLISQLFTPENTNWSYGENSIETTVISQADLAKLASTTTVPQQGETRRALDNPNFEIGLEIFLKNNYSSMISVSDLLNISAVNKNLEQWTLFGNICVLKKCIYRPFNGAIYKETFLKVTQKSANYRTNLMY